MRATSRTVEEEGAAGGGAGRRWVIDPINGITLFVRRIPTFNMLLAIEVDDRPLVSVIHYPVTATTYFAGVGEVAWGQQPVPVARPGRPHDHESGCLYSRHPITLDGEKTVFGRVIASDT